MSPEKLKRQAQRMVSEGMKSSAALRREAWRDRRMARLMIRHEANDLIKRQRARRMRSLCGRMAAQHGIALIANGRGMASPTAA